MKILWVSPSGDGQETATRLVASGHTVVGWGPLVEIPTCEKVGLASFAEAADLVVVDGTFPLVPTRRSWRPSTESLFFDELRRHHQVVALGPTPTVDLLVGDARYLRKIMGRFGIPAEPMAGSMSDSDESWSSGAWFLGNRVVPDGPYLASLVPLFKSVGFRGWFELTGLVTPDGPVVTGCNADWPPDTLPEGREAAWLQEMAA